MYVSVFRLQGIVLDECTFQDQTSLYNSNSVWLQSLTSMSAVCQRWRQVALASPHIWSFILVTGTTGNTAMVPEFLRRARSAPLTVAIFLPKPAPYPLKSYSMVTWRRLRVTKFACLVLPELGERIAWLGIHGDTAFAHATLDILARHPLPTLTKLCVEHYDDPSGTSGMHRLSRFLDADHIMPGPNLRHLHLVKIIPATWNNLQGLTTLRVRDAGLAASFRLTDFLSALGRSPNLKVLDIRLHKHHDEADLRQSSETLLQIALPMLERLTLGYDPDLIMSILTHIVPPSTTLLTIEVRIDKSDTVVLLESDIHYSLLPLGKMGNCVVLHDAAASSKDVRICTSLSVDGRSRASFHTSSLIIKLDLPMPWSHPSISSDWLCIILQSLEPTKQEIISIHQDFSIN